MKKIILFTILISFTVNFYSQNINKNENSIIERFILPDDYERISVEENSFSEYLRKYPLKKYGSPVLLYNGEEKKIKYMFRFLIFHC